MTVFVHDGSGPARAPAKDPDGVIDYGVAWDDWLKTDTIASSAWIKPAELVSLAEQENISVTIDGVSYAKVNTVMVSGGVAGEHYLLTNRITTAGGRTTDRSMRIGVIEQ